MGGKTQTRLTRSGQSELNNYVQSFAVTGNCHPTHRTTHPNPTGDRSLREKKLLFPLLPSSSPATVACQTRSQPRRAEARPGPDYSENGQNVHRSINPSTFPSIVPQNAAQPRGTLPRGKCFSPASHDYPASHANTCLQEALDML